MIDALNGTTASAATAPEVRNPGGTLGRDEFLQLLVAQLKNQDPLNPMNAEEFAAQLAQFSSLEQLMNINESIGQQIDQTAALTEATTQATALEVVGREVLAVGNALDIGEEGAPPIVLGVGGEGGVGKVTIFDEQGSPVGQISVAFEAGGRQEVELPESLQGLEPGRYSYAVELQDGVGSTVEVQTFSRIRIDGVRYGPGGPVLVSGDLEIPLSNVVEVLGRIG